MVGVITGGGLGLQTSSRDVLGALGQWGSAALGRAQENVYVNAATGNLVIQKHDDFVMGLGSSSLISRTYNSLGDFSDDNGDNWRVNQKKVDGLTGTLNTVGSTVTRTDWDGSKTVYTWDATRSQYVCKDGGGAHESIIFNAGGNFWHWTDGTGVRYEYYDPADGGRIGAEGLRGGSYNSYQYNYNSNGQIYRIWASGSALTEFSYSGNNITSMATYSNGGQIKTYFTYDSSNRLTSTIVDLTPTDFSIADGKTYVTTYTYDGSSKRVASITQTDGTSLAIGYTLVGSNYRVTSLTQTVSSGVTRTTTLSYNTSTRVTTITDPQSQTTALAYDAAGQLLSVTAASRTTAFTYDGDGNVLTVTEPSGEVTTYTYDANGNRTLARDQAGNTTTWTYNGRTDQVLSETHYRVADPDGAGSGAASDGVTTRNAYSPYNKLRFTVSAEGRVTEYRYHASGQVESVIDYGDSLYTTGGVVYDTTLEAWVSGLSDKSNTTRTDTTYDFRGNVSTVTSYGKVLTGGAGDTSATSQISKTYFVYDVYGQLLSRQVEGNAATETFVYDGLGRLIGSTDMLGKTTTIAFNDASSQTVITLDNGSTTTSVYNLAGELVSTSVAGSGVTTATSSYKYDSLGRLKISIDPAGNKSFFLYDPAGFKVADIAADGGLVEYKYNADGQVIATVAYANRLSSGTLATLVDSSGNPTSVGLSSVRPSASADDKWAWSIYDAAGRLVETINGAGMATTFTYDGASQLVSTRTYANALSVSGYKTTPPTTQQLPSAHPDDRVTRNFYDDEGNLEGVLDASGSLSKIVYDGAGRKVETIAYATRPNSAYRAAGTFADLLTSAGTSASDVRTRFVYDGRGLLRGTVNAEGGVTSLSYDAAGRVTKAVQHAVLYTSSGVPDFDDLQSWISSNSGSGDRITRTIYDAAGQAVYGVDAEGFVTKKEYDFAGRVTKEVRYAVAVSATDGMSPAGMAALLPGSIPSTAAVTTYAYDSVGRLTDMTDAEGGVTHSVYNVLGQVTDVTVAYLTSDASRTHYTYDVVGQVLTETHADGETCATTTQYTYDAFGQVTDRIEAFGTGDAARTSYTYNAAGQLTYETRSYGYPGETTTRYIRDAFGQVFAKVVAANTTEGATTRYFYDGMGRVTSEIRASGEGYASKTEYEYDAFGQVKSRADGLAYGASATYSTTFTYDRRGLLLTTTVPLDGSTNAVTSSQYDAFGNLVKLTDPRGNAAYYYYDKLGRQTLQIDPEGYATATAYDGLGQTASVTRYDNATSGAAVGAPPTPTGAAATTTFLHDRLGRVTRVTDAEGKYENYTLDALGNRTVVRNKLGGITNNTYDKLGQLLEEQRVITWTTAGGSAASTTITNKYEYDKRGNRTKSIEAYGLTEQRDTIFVYNKLDHLVEEIGEQVTNLLSDFQSTESVTTSEKIKYDLRGNIVQTEDANGAKTWHWYDILDRKIAQVDAGGALSTWTYDLNGNIVSAKVWETPVTSPSLVTVPTGSGNYRETTYTYDRNNRRLSTSIAGLKSGSYASGYAVTTGTITTQTNYDANGNVVQEIDGEGNSAYHYYDKLGRKKATVDREGFVTTYALDADGNVLTERRYAAKTSSASATAFTAPSTGADDRVTVFTYDQNGRRLTEKRTGVVAWTVNTTTGALAAASTDAVITYTYNGLGQVLTRTEASGETTSYAYDSSGRLAFTTAPSFTDYLNTSVARVTEYAYDGLNNVLTERIGLATAAPSTDHVTSYNYGAQGRLTSVVDANGFTRTYGYDRAGNMVREQYTRTKSNGSTVTEANLFKYDALGRQTFQAKAEWNGSSWRIGGDSGVADLDRQEIEYNAYGEISAKKTNGGGSGGAAQETFEYDKAGRLVKTTAGDGTPRFFVHDKNGNVTLTISSTGTDLTSYSVDSAISALGTIGASWVAGVASTISVYDKLGQNISTIEVQRQLASSGSSNLTSSKTFTAFGEVASETDARGHTTNYAYNTAGKMVEKKNPTVSVTAENGAVTSVRPTETSYYDRSGRLIGFDDANGNRTTRQLLAGTGYGGAEALVTAEHHADGGVKKTGYDVFGNAITLTNEINKVETRGYDKMGNMLTASHAGGLVDSYAYDQLGQRTQHWNNQFTSSFKEYTDYDAQGRVIRTADYEGTAITYAYAWSGSLTTSGLATFGGWTKTTVQYGAYTSTEKSDVFGRTIGKTDFGGVTYTYGFNSAGWLTTQSSTDGQSLTYTYFNTGQVATITDASQSGSGLTSLTTYGYDAAGNKLSESFSATKSGVTTVFQNATSTYDAMNRREQVTDTARGGASSTYAYDAAGNVRQGEGAWYKYDAMNRVVRQGNFVGTAGSGSIERGVDMLYNSAGQRTRVVRTGSVTENVTGWYVPQYWVPTQTGGGYYEYGPFLIDQNDPEIEYFKEEGNTFDDFARDGDGNVGMLQFYSGEFGYWCMSGERWVEEWTIEGHYEGNYTINGPHTAPTDMIEIYAYDDAGYLASVSRTHKHLQGGGEATPVLWTEDTRDLLGRVTEHMEFLPDTTTPSYRETNSYDKRSNLLSKWTGMKRGGAPYRYSETTFTYLDMVYVGFNVWTSTGAYQGGTVTSTATKSWEADSWTEATKNALTSIHYNRADSSVRNDTDWRDGPRVAYEYSTFGGSTYTSTHTYDANGYLTSVAVADGAPITKYFLTDARGQMLQRKTRSTASPGASGLAYFQNPPSGGGFWGSDQTLFRFDGYQFGSAETGSYQQGIDERYWGRDPDAAQGFFTTPTSQPSASASYTVRAGETLASIAAQTWGDASLWYVIAEANGLSGSGQVAPGQTLIIPNKAVRTHYNADTFRPYDGSELVGPTGASKPHVNRNKGDCGVLGVVIKMLVTIAVLSIMPTATSFLQGALFGGVANVAAQGVGMMTGIQDGFNWKELGTSAVSGGVAGELSGVKLFDKLGAFSEVGRQAAGGAISQGIAVATGLQDKMDWAGVAMAGVMGGVSGLIKGGNLLGSLKGTLFGDGVANMAGALAAAGAKHIIDGSSFGDNLKSLLPSVVGQTIGDAIARSRAADRVKQRAERRAQSAAELIRASKYPFEVTTDGAGSVMNVMKDGMPVRRTDVGAGSGMIDLGAEPDVVIGGENYAWRYTDGVDLSSGQKVSTGHNASSIVYVSDGSASGTLSSHGWGNPENNTIIHSLTNDVGQSYLWVDNADIAMGATASIPALGLSIWRTTAGSGYYEAQYASQVLGERLDDIDRAYAAGVGNHWALPYMSQPARNDFYAANIRSQPFRDHWSTKVMSAPAVLASGALGGEAEILGYLAVGAKSLMAGRTAGVVSVGSAATRSRVLANIAESKAAREASNFATQARFETAYNFYAEGGWSASRTLNHVRGIDLSKPVDVIDLAAGTRVGQYQVPGAPIGNYFAPLGTSASELGMNPAGRVLYSYTAAQNVPALRSTAAPILDTWSIPGAPYQAAGGGTQYFTYLPQLFK